MKKLRLSSHLRSQIYQEARKKVSGANPLFEAGLRAPYGQLTSNMRIWGTVEWGGDLVRLAQLKEIELDWEGFCTLDLYATTGGRGKRELERNVYVSLTHNQIFDVRTDDARPYNGYRVPGPHQLQRMVVRLRQYLGSISSCYDWRDEYRILGNLIERSLVQYRARQIEASSLSDKQIIAILTH